MSRRRRQLPMSDPNVFLLFPLLARPHRHTRILRILPVDPSNSFAYASDLHPGLLGTATPGLATRPNRVAGQSVSGPKTVSEWFNTSAFTAPAPGFFGNATP